MRKTDKEYVHSDNDEALIERHWYDALQAKYGTEVHGLIERAWAAGFFDGEGHASAATAGGSFSCSIDQTRANSLVLERFRRAVGAGKVIERPDYGGGSRKPTSRWLVSNQDDLQKVYEAIGDFLSNAKRTQFARALSVPIRSALQNDRPLSKDALGIEVPPGKRVTKPKNS